MRVIPALFVLFIGFGVFAQSTSADAETAAGPVITFEETSHNFGDITTGDRVEHEFSYTNTGNEPLILSSVQTSCGCTAPNWSREPLAPGDSAILKVVFNSTGKRGMQNKVITVNSNAKNNPVRVRITSNVLTKEQSLAAGQPEN